MMSILWRTQFSVLAVAVATLCAAELRAQQLPPSNDNLASAVEVSGVEFQLAADLGAATREAFEPYSQYNFGRTAWWRWTAPADGIYEWNSRASSNSVAVAICLEDAFEQLTVAAATYPRLQDNVLVPDSTGSFQANQGARYAIQLDLTSTNYLGSASGPPWWTVGSRPVSAEFRKSDRVAPPNNDFASRSALFGSNVLFTVDLAAATSEVNEPKLATGALQRTLWWTWEAPGFGSAIIRRSGTNDPPVVGIYARGNLGLLDLIASSATEFGNECYRDPRAHDSVDWDTVPGGRYEIQVDRFAQFTATRSVELELAFMPAPSNDTPAGALLLVGPEATLVVTNTAATRRVGELTIPTQSGSNSVWFRWTSPARGIVQATRFEPIHYNEPSYDPGSTIGVIGVHVGPCSGGLVDLYPPPPFVPVFGLFAGGASQPDQPPGPTTLLGYGTNGLIAEVPGAGDYWIELDGDLNTSGTTSLNLLLITPPANDNFTNRIELPSESLRITGRTFAATREGTDPGYVENNRFLDRNVWWEWHAPSAGRWTLFVVKGGGENKFVVYHGDTATTQNEAGSTEHEPVIFECAAGETVQIGVFALAGFGGNIEFTLTPLVAPSPRLLSVMNYWWGDRSVQLQLPDNSGLIYIVERSDDLSNWTPISTNANAWSHVMSLPSDSGRPAEFFRTRLQDSPLP
jgi:hypothetical protein